MTTLIFGPKSSFIGPRQFVRRKSNIRYTKAAFKKVCNNDLDQFAKTVIAQKAMAVSGATPEQVKNFVEQCFAF